MDKDRIHQLAAEVKALVEQYGIPAEMVALNLRVSKDYFDTIKENFPDRHPQLDNFVYQAGDDWSVTLAYAWMLRKQDDDPELPDA